MQGHPWLKQVMVGASRGRLPNKPWGQEDTLEARNVTEGIRKTRERHEGAVDSLCPWLQGS